MPALLVARNVSKHFGGVAAVQAIDLTIDEDEIVGLIGPNGAGKTTFINLITGMERLTAGEVTFRGVPIAHRPAYRIGQLGIARTFQVVKPFAKNAQGDACEGSVCQGCGGLGLRGHGREVPARRR